MRRAVVLAAFVIVTGSAPSAPAADASHPKAPAPELRAEMVYHDGVGGVAPAGAAAERPWPQDRSDRPIDVLHYSLNLSVSDISSALDGTVQITLRPLQAMTQVVLDLLSGELTVTSVTVDGAPATFIHATDLLTVDVGRAVDASDTLTIAVSYGGAPSAFRLMGYTRSLLGPVTGGERPPVVQSVSAPDAARSWWPCHDTPFDAASVTLTVTTPAAMRLVSAGTLTEDVSLPGDPELRRQTWDMPTPIPAYLVSIAASAYANWSDVVDVTAGDGQPVSMRLEYYAAPALETAARASWSNTGEIVRTFERLFGPYPFADLKYGMAMVDFTGGMEHPTLSSIGSGRVSSQPSPLTGGPSNESLVAHELSHQWFGDCVRLQRWGDVWLNEGFARYAEVLWFEEKYGPQIAKEWLMQYWADDYPGTVIDPDALFNTTVYDKGAWILHMLRQVMGRDALLRAMRSYLADPALRFRPVSVADFQHHCQDEYGQPLDWFFEPWLHRAGRPHLTVEWTQSEATAFLRVLQPVEQSYRLPLPVRLQFAAAAARDTTLWIEGPVTAIELPLPAPLSALQVDPEQDWLLETAVVPTLAGVAAHLYPPYPNPFNPRVTLQVFFRATTHAQVSIHDARGRLVRQLFDGALQAGLSSLDWDGHDDGGAAVASGNYFVRVEADDGFVDQKPMALLK